MSLCFCGSNRTYTECCGPYLSGEKIAPTPEALMRSRYSAFAQANVDYIIATMRNPAAADFEPISAKTWAEQAQWLRLEVLQAPPVAENEHKGFVEFIAHYRITNQNHKIHELSEFHLDQGRWYYVNGKSFSASTRPRTKIGRNDDCPCGSGKKYKKCCLII